MAIRSLKNGTFSRSLLVGNSYYIPPAYDWIASATGTGSSNTITFSSIPSTYKHLQIRVIARDTNVNDDFSSIRMQFNSDTGTNYTRHILQGNGSTVIASSSTSATSINIQAAARQNGSSSNVMGASVIDIHDYASTTKNKTIRAFSGNDDNDTTGAVALTSGLWINTNAVNRVDLLTSSGFWSTQTKFMLFGIRAGA